MTETADQTATPFELCVTLDLFSHENPSRRIPLKGTTFGIKLAVTDIPADVGPLINEHFGEKFSFALVLISEINPYTHAGLLYLECRPKKEIKDGT